MSTIVTRSGKGSPLTTTELDANFTNLNTDKIQSGNTVAALTITAAVVSNDLTVDTNTLKVDSTNNRVGILNASPDVALDVGSATDSMHVPTGTTGQRPASPSAGYFRYNSTTGGFEGYTSEWGEIGGGGANLTTNNYSGNGSTTAFTLSIDPSVEQNTFVYIDGVYQQKNTYSTSGTTLTFSTAPENGASIEVMSMTATSSIVGTVSDNAITTAKIANDAVTTAKIADDAVGADQLAASAVVTASIVDDAVTAAKLASSAVVTGSIVDDNVTQAKIADDAVGADQLASNAVVTASIVDDNVTQAKIADDAVGADQLASSAVVTASLVDDAVTSAKLANAVDVTTSLGVGGGSTNGVAISQGAIALKNGGTRSNIDFYCEVGNAHYTRLQAAAHGSYSGNIVLTLPFSTGTSGQAMVTDGSGNLSFATMGGAYNSWLIKTSAYTALVSDQIIVNSASAVTITLPASASAGNTVIIKATGGGTVTVGRNSQNINSVAADSTIFSGNAAQLVYVDGTVGFLEI